ncbi:MAG: GspH/FimT family pseudopilin [Alphaproteobacteria bacterium]|nr:GspH/FimT family pseudopilin [Alphaproteobacteria bacterium]
MPTSPVGERSRNRRQFEAGFSLIELLAVVVILSIATMSVLSWRGSGSARVSIQAEAARVAVRLREARVMAIRNGRPTLVTVDTGTGRIDGPTGSVLIGRGGNTAITATTAASEQQSGQRVGIRFFPNGSSSGATLRFSRGRHGAEVRVNWLTGRVSLTGS